MKRKIPLAMALVALAVSILSVGTLAFFSVRDQTINRITMGNVHAELIEQTKTEQGVVPYPAETVTGVMPGEALSKIVFAKNTGGSAIWVRMRAVVTCTVTDDNGKDAAADAAGITPQYNTADWTAGADGWYYYNAALAPEAVTPPLFETVTFSLDLGNDYADAKVQVAVSLEAVQSVNNGASALLAAGWPAA